MQLASSYVRAGRSARVLDLGCGLGYSSLWLADAAGRNGDVIAIDNDPDHIDEARRLAERAGLGARIRYVVGNVAEVLPTLSGPFDAVHDDAWFASAPAHLDAMIDRLRAGGVLTMPNWFLLVDAISGHPRENWERFAGPAWAADTLAYAAQLAARRDLSVNWITEPPLGVAVKL
jgi:predicted O-methyltransferase YrrM